MSIVAGEETTVEVAGTDVGDLMIKPEEIGGSLVAIIQLDDGGLAQVLSFTVCSHCAYNIKYQGSHICDQWCNFKILGSLQESHSGLLRFTSQMRSI